MTNRDLPRSWARPASLAGAALAAAFGLAAPVEAAWEVSHGTPANTGFVDVATAPAGKGSTSVPGLGTFAPGAGPVVGADGTVFLGTVEGKVIALRPDGSPYWSRDITPGQSIVASPAVSSDGSVFVIGVTRKTIRDHRDGKSEERTIFESTLQIFTPGGGWLGPMPLPPHGIGGAAASAAPNILRTTAGEFVLVPVIYDLCCGMREMRLIVFTTSGQVVADQKMSHFTPQVTGGADISLSMWIGCSFPPTTMVGCAIGAMLAEADEEPGPRPQRKLPMLPPVAVFTFAGGGAPWLLMSDQVNALVGATFTGGGTITETFRFTDAKRRLASPPTALPDGHTLVGTADGAILFAGPNSTKIKPVTGLGPVVAAPTRTPGGNVVVMQTDGRIAVLNGAGKLITNGSFGSRSIVSAAASRTHVYASLGDALYSFDAATMAVARKFDWVGGGISPPAIGPQGHVYAIASNILFVFPPPRAIVGQVVGKAQTAGTLQTATTSSTPPPPAPPPAPTGPQRFDDPKGPGGLRLYACTEVGGETCGKPVATAFCQGQGFAKAGKLDTDNEKVKAETLGGEVCSKKRCKVFEYIECRN